MTKQKEKLTYYPLAVRLKKRRVIVIGGGTVAERKVKKLHEVKARVCVIAPHITADLHKMEKKGMIKWLRRCVRKSDIHDAYIIIVATNNSGTNKKVSYWAQEAGIWINVVDKPTLSDFISPAIFHSDSAIVTVYTDGKDPVLSRDIKNFLKEQWDAFLSYRNRLQNSPT